MKANIFIKTVLMIIFSSFIIMASSKPGLDERSKTFSVKKGGTLVMKINPGDIEIRTWEKDEVTFLVRGLDNEELEDLDFKSSGNRVTIDYDSKWGWSQNARFIVSGPKEFNYEVSTSSGEVDIVGNITGSLDLVTMSGDIIFDDVKGSVKLKTYGGDIKAGNIDGRLDLNTQGGDIRIANIKTGPADIQTMGGDIKIRDVENDIDVKTYGGDIEVGNIKGNADVVTYGGDIDVKEVGGDAHLETYGGDIKLLGATGIVYASTNGGDLRLYNVTGSVDAKTSAGDIYLELNPSGKGKTRLESSYGSIILVVPASAKASIEAEIRLNRRHSRDDERYKIVSDFDSETYNVDRNEKEIFATYKLNGGGERIYLKTVNSNIEIRKAK